jgi:hypothetical protein
MHLDGTAGRRSGELQIFTRYARYVALLKYSRPVLFSYVICAIMVKAAWTDVAGVGVGHPVHIKRR